MISMLDSGNEEAYNRGFQAFFLGVCGNLIGTKIITEVPNHKTFKKEGHCMKAMASAGKHRKVLQHISGVTLLSTGSSTAELGLLYLSDSAKPPASLPQLKTRTLLDLIKESVS